MISEQEKKEVLQKILESPEFKESKRYAELLEFLVGKANISENLKETTIAHEFFGREASFDPGKDSFVRSYISSLRKKIEHYYLTVQEPVKYQICIPKGQYNIHFINAEVANTKNISFKFTKTHAFLLFLSIPTISLLIYFFVNYFNPGNSQNALLNDPFLSSFIGTPTNKTIIAIGDYFFFTDNKPLPETRTYFRNSDINNEKDFQEWIEKNPENKLKYEPLNFTYHRTSTCVGLFSIINRFKNTENFEVKMASELKWQDFEKRDIIFVGSLKTLYIIDTLLRKTNFRYNLVKKEISILKKNGETGNTYSLHPVRAGRFSEDYSVVLKIPNSYNSILILTGFSEVGISGAVEIAMDTNFLDSVKTTFNKRLDNPRQFFSIISKSKGVHQTVFGYKMESFNSMYSIE